MKRTVGIFIAALILFGTASFSMARNGDPVIEGKTASGNIATTGDLQGADVTATDMDLGTSTYTSLTDWVNVTQASGVISGGGFTDNGDGTMTVAAGTGFIKTSASAIGDTKFFNWSANAAVSLTNQVTNYVGIDYNAGSPQVFVETTKTADGRTKFYLGKVFKEGTDLHFLEAGQNITELMKRVQARFTGTDGEFTRASGMMLSESGNRYLAITAGVGFTGLTRITTAAIDTAVAGTFELYYYDGAAWQESDVSVIPNTQYNNVASGLVDLTANRYGVYWVYLANDGEPLVIYGQGDYTLALAENATPPTSVPQHVSDFSVIIGKIIVQESEPNFYTVETAFNPGFNYAGIYDHGELSGLSDDDHTQYVLANGTRSITMTNGAGALDVNLGTSAGDYFTVDSTSLVVEGDTKNVGIGTASPAAKLDVAGSGASTDFRVSRSSNPSAYLYITSVFGSYSTAILGLNGASTMSLNLAGGVAVGNSYSLSTVQAPNDGLIVEGNMGIGVTDPDVTLEVFKAGTQLKLSYDGTNNSTLATDTDGNLNIIPSGGNVALTGLLSVSGDSIVIATNQSPASDAACTTGEIAWDSGWIYVCTASGVWKRAQLTGGY